MRPIRQGDGTGISEVRLGDGTGISEVRRGDGTVLWSSDPDIPDSVVDSYEDQDISEYFGDTSEYSVVNSPVFDGSYALQASGIDSDHDIWSTSGLDVYPEAGYPWQTSVLLDSGEDGNAKVRFGVQDTDNFYQIFLDNYAGSIELSKIEFGTGSSLASASTNPPPNVWLRLDVDWQADGTINVSIVNTSDGTVVETLSATDTTFTSGGISVGSFFDANVFDYFYIKP